jgi:hypothetical protein
MIKIKLSLDDLHVESFTTSGASHDQGTVLGHEKTDTTCGGVTGCGSECETYYGVGFCSADDGCATAPHAYTPCAGCPDTAVCLIGG